MVADLAAAASLRRRRLVGLAYLEVPDPLPARRQPLATTVGPRGQPVTQLRPWRWLAALFLLAGIALGIYGFVLAAAPQWLQAVPIPFALAVLCSVLLTSSGAWLLDAGSQAILAEHALGRIHITRSGLIRLRHRQADLADYHGVVDFVVTGPRWSGWGPEERAGSLLVHRDPALWVVIDRRVTPEPGRSAALAAWFGVPLVGGLVTLFSSASEAEGAADEDDRGWFGDVFGGNGGHAGGR